MLDARIGYIKGDGIGPEIMPPALEALDEIARQGDYRFGYVHIPAGGEAYDLTGSHLPDSSIEAAQETDAVLKSPLGGPPNSRSPKWRNLETEAIVGLRRELGLYANLRPTSGRLAKRLAHLSPSRNFSEAVDIMIVRDLAGDAYTGKKDSGIDENGKRWAYETIAYDEDQVRNIVRVGIQQARQREQPLTLVHKTNVLTETGPLWKDIVEEMTDEAKVKTNYMHVDAMAAALADKPETVGTVVTSNLFGDILTDEASALLGSLGLGGSASLGSGSFGLYEPIHGSSPDIGGYGKANPSGLMLSMAMMLRHSLGMPEEAAAVEAAVGRTLDKGYLTADLYARYQETSRLGHIMDYVKGHRAFEVSTAQFSRQVAKELRRAA